LAGEWEAGHTRGYRARHQRQNLHQWKQRFKSLPAGQVAGTLEALQAENRRLQRELQRVSVQRDILKRTSGIISEPPGNGLLGYGRMQEGFPIYSSLGRAFRI